VPRDVVRWYCGAGQDELPRFRAVIDCPSDLVPDRRLGLPLVDESRGWAIEHQRGIDRNSLSSVQVDIEKDLTRSDLPCRGRLSARPWPLDDDGANGL
jgi:hypothetical protein